MNNVPARIIERRITDPRMDELKSGLSNQGVPSVLGDMVSEWMNPVVRALYTTRHAFAAHLSDGRLLIWGRMHGTVRNVATVLACTMDCFIAILSNGDAVAIGEDVAVSSIRHDGASVGAARVVQVCDIEGRRYEWGDQDQHRQQFVALLEDGSVIWRGFVTEPHTSKICAKRLFAGQKQVVAVLNDNKTMHFWYHGFSRKSIVEAKYDVETVEFTLSSIAVRLSNGDVITLPQTEQFDCVTLAKKDVKFRSAMPILDNVRHLYANMGSFAALHVNGTVSTWGDERYGSNSQRVQRSLSGVREISYTKFGFAAMSHINKIMWGNGWGTILPIGEDKKIYPSNDTFLTLTADGALSGQRMELKNVERVYSDATSSFRLVELKNGHSVASSAFTGYTDVTFYGQNDQVVINLQGIAILQRDGGVRVFGHANTTMRMPPELDLHQALDDMTPHPDTPTVCTVVFSTAAPTDAGFGQQE